MVCKKCNQSFDSKFAFCPYCGAKNEVAIQGKYNNIYGVWSVTTEGDCEGRSIKNLGTHEGYVDEIAFNLASQCYYSLEFTKVREGDSDRSIRHKKEVHIHFNIESGTWDMDSKQRAEKIKKAFGERPVSVEESNYFASIKLVRK